MLVKKLHVTAHEKATVALYGWPANTTPGFDRGLILSFTLLGISRACLAPRFSRYHAPGAIGVQGLNCVDSGVADGQDRLRVTVFQDDKNKERRNENGLR
jgi:hypothetical protein